MNAESMWLPASSCDTNCLPAGHGTGLADGVRAAGRLATAGLVLAMAALLTLPLMVVGPVQRSAILRLLARALLAGLGVHSEPRGRVPHRAALIVANHIAWLDILVLLAHLPVRLVAKHQVRRWPMIGWLASAAGTVFVDRSRPHSLPLVVAQVAEALHGGHTVAVFPEGTTWCGKTTGRFRPAMFQAAVDASAPVVPVSLHYRSVDGRDTTAAAFLGDDTLVASLLRIVCMRGLRVDVTMHPALHPGPGVTRRLLSRAAHASVRRLSVHPQPSRQLVAASESGQSSSPSATADHSRKHRPAGLANPRDPAATSPQQGKRASSPTEMRRTRFDGS